MGGCCNGEKDAEGTLCFILLRPCVCMSLQICIQACIRAWDAIHDVNVVH